MLKAPSPALSAIEVAKQILGKSKQMTILDARDADYGGS